MGALHPSFDITLLMREYSCGGGVCGQVDENIFVAAWRQISKVTFSNVLRCFLFLSSCRSDLHAKIIPETLIVQNDINSTSKCSRSVKNPRPLPVALRSTQKGRLLRHGGTQTTWLWFQITQKCHFASLKKSSRWFQEEQRLPQKRFTVICFAA